MVPTLLCGAARRQAIVRIEELQEIVRARSGRILEANLQSVATRRDFPVAMMQEIAEIRDTIPRIAGDKLSACTRKPHEEKKPAERLHELTTRLTARHDRARFQIFTPPCHVPISARQASTGVWHFCSSLSASVRQFQQSS
jgi:hypothetical protein